MFSLDDPETEEMRQRADWMNPVDDQILEFILEAGAGTPQSIANEIGGNNDYIGVRCRTLAAYGLLDRPSRGVYSITESGELFLDGELDTSTLEKSDES